MHVRHGNQPWRVLNKVLCVCCVCVPLRAPATYIMPLRYAVTLCPYVMPLRYASYGSTLVT